MRPFGRVLLYGISVAYAAWSVHSIAGAPERERLFGIIGCSIFLFLYLLPSAVFVADVKLQAEGLLVKQYGDVLIPFSDLRGCRRLFWVPFKIIAVTTKRRFPRNLLIFMDVVGPKELTNDELLAAIRSRIEQARMR